MKDKRKRVANVLKVNPKRIADAVDEWCEQRIDDEIRELYNQENFYRACEETRIANEMKAAELHTYGYKKSTKMVGGRVVESKVGWSDDGSFFMGNTQWHPSWRGIVTPRLHAHMMHVNGEQYWTATDKEHIKHRKNLVKQWIFGNKLNEKRTFGGVDFGTDNTKPSD